MDPIIIDYILKNFNTTEKEAKETAALIAQNKELENECSGFCLTRRFPAEEQAICIGGYTAQSLYKKYNINEIVAYTILVQLSPDEKIPLTTLKKRISPPVNAVIGFDYPYLIIKRNLFWIRFFARKHFFDIPIDEEQTKELVNKNITIEELLESELKKYPHTQDKMIDSELKAYAKDWRNLDAFEIDCMFLRLAGNNDIKYEFYDTLITSEFPEEGIEAYGFTSKKLFYDKDFDLLDSYVILAWLRDEPQTALEALNADNL